MLLKEGRFRDRKQRPGARNECKKRQSKGQNKDIRQKHQILKQNQDLKHVIGKQISINAQDN